MIYNFKIEGHAVSKKKSKRIVKNGGKNRLISSEAYYEWDKKAKACIRASHLPSEPIKTACIVDIVFCMADKMRRDLTKMADGVMGVLVETGVLHDDCWSICQVVNLQAQYTGCAEIMITIRC